MLLLIAGAVAFAVVNTLANIERLNIRTGFEFLTRPAGFDIAQRLIPYTERSSYLSVFVVALLNTIVLTVVAGTLATILGFVIGLGRLSSNRLVAAVAAAYVEVVRNVPLLLQLFYWYFAVLRPLPPPRQSLGLFDVVFLNNRGLYVPTPVFGPGVTAVLLALLMGLVGAVVVGVVAHRHRVRTGRRWPAGWLMCGLVLAPPVAVAFVNGFSLSWDVPVLTGFNFRGGVAIIPEFVAMTVALSLYGASYIAEIVRAGVQAVPLGQKEAALALGMRNRLVVTKIVVPQALRVILPPLGGQYIQLLKNSSLAAAIAYPDLMLIFAGTVLNQTGQPLEVMIITMATYLLLGLAIAAAVNLYNRRIARVER